MTNPVFVMLPLLPKELKSPQLILYLQIPFKSCISIFPALRRHIYRLFNYLDMENIMLWPILKQQVCLIAPPKRALI